VPASAERLGCCGAAASEDRDIAGIPTYLPVKDHKIDRVHEYFDMDTVKRITGYAAAAE
jgi:hypothetical protein